VPESLVVVRRYVYRELAAGDEELLAAAGLTAYLKPSGGRQYALMVAEADVERATHLLESSPQLVEEWRDSPKCPRCHSVEAEPRPPYTLIAGGIGFAISAVLIARGGRIAGTVIACLTVLVASAVWLRVPQWRCRKCGCSYRAR
jgi:hypothetical protein